MVGLGRRLQKLPSRPVRQYLSSTKPAQLASEVHGTAPSMSESRKKNRNESFHQVDWQWTSIDESYTEFASLPRRRP